MRKVFLDDLPRKQGFGYNKGKEIIDWKMSRGCKVKFIYDDIEGWVEIIDTEDGYLTIKYLDREPFRIHTGSFTKCTLGKLLCKYTFEFKYDIGHTFKDDKRNMIVTNKEYRPKEQKPDKKGRVYIHNEKWYNYKCNICGWEGWIVEGHLSKGCGCSSCVSKVVTTLNNIWNTNRWMVDLGISEEDAKKYTKASNQKVEVTCTECGSKRKVTVGDVYQNKTIRCSCGDGISYPEKFITSMLLQLNIDFERQYSPDWIKPRRYDFYIPKYNTIIETHGSQHYVDNTGFSETLKEIQENDRIKKEAAFNNGLDKYIVIDCRCSDINYIKNNICNSELTSLFDLSQINWLECEKFALKNIVKKVCEYWNNKEDWETTNSIANNNEWGVKSGRTIRRYLKKGVKHGWCEYEAKEEYIKGVRRLNKTGNRVGIFKDEVLLDVYVSCTELSRQSKKKFGVKLLNSSISRVCNGYIKQYKGFTFKYINENQQIVS